MTSASDTEHMTPKSPEYEHARIRAQKKHKFRGDVAAYVVINAVSIGVWAATGFGYLAGLGPCGLGRVLGARCLEHLLP